MRPARPGRVAHASYLSSSAILVAYRIVVRVFVCFVTGADVVRLAVLVPGICRLVRAGLSNDSRSCMQLPLRRAQLLERTVTAECADAVPNCLVRQLHLQAPCARPTRPRWRNAGVQGVGDADLNLPADLHLPAHLRTPGSPAPPGVFRLVRLSAPPSRRPAHAGPAHRSEIVRCVACAMVSHPFSTQSRFSFRSHLNAASRF